MDFDRTVKICTRNRRFSLIITTVNAWFRRLENHTRTSVYVCVLDIRHMSRVLLLEEELIKVPTVNDNKIKKQNIRKLVCLFLYRNYRLPITYL